MTEDTGLIRPHGSSLGRLFRVIDVPIIVAVSYTHLTLPTKRIV